MKRLSYFLFFFVLTCTQSLLSQNINGYRIYVSKLYATTLYFHDAYSKYGFGETTSPYKFNSLLGDEKSIALEVSNDVTEPYTLYVTEGGRKHKFIVLYKERLEDSERDIYLTDLDKVAQLSKNLNNSPISQPTKSETPVVTPTVIDSAQTNDMKYKDLVNRANNAFSSDRLDDAMKFYTAALAMKPDDIFLNTQVQIIQKKMYTAKIEEENRRKDSSFKSYIDAGDKLLNEKIYSAAKIAYEEALKINPGNPVALERLKAVDQNIFSDSAKAQQQKKEDMYVKYLNLGDTAMMKKSYSSAKIAYEQALQIKPNDADVLGRLRNLNEIIVKDSLDAVNQRNDALYTAYISTADKAFGEKLFDKAKSGYDSALVIKPHDDYANNQIKKIDNLLTEQQRQAQKDIELEKDQALQKQYKDLISKADQEYNSTMYDEALKDYAKALEISKNDQYSKNKITQIKNILNEKQLKLKQDSIIDAKYSATVKKADDAFDIKDYANARSLYKSALAYKNNDEYSNNRIIAIEHILTEETLKKQAEKDSLNKINEVSKKYTNLILDAQKAYNAKDYTSARIMLSEATGLKPNETEAANKLAAIDSELVKIAENQVIKNKSDSLITNGEIALATQQFPQALDNFTNAIAVNLPEQQHYLQMQIRFVQDQLNILEHQKQNEELKQGFDTAMSVYRQGNDAIAHQNFDDALFYFKKFLDIVGNMDSVTLEKSQYNNLGKIIKYIRNKISSIEDNLTREKVAADNKDTVHIVTPKVYGSYAPTIYYPTPKDPKLNYVYKKYSDIGFNSSPPDQHFDSLLNYSIQSNLISREIMSLKPDLELTDSSHGVKLICQNVELRHNNIYFKFLVQNYDTIEFLTGRMLLSYKPHNKDSVKVYPNYVANYPIILGGSQKVLVYVIKPITITDEENLHFELIDRLNKLKLGIVIPGSVYNKEQKN